MSYILDALKKSEQERGHGNIPDVQTVHSSGLNYRNETRKIWPYILIAAVTLNLLAITYFITTKNDTSSNQKIVQATPAHEKSITEYIATEPVQEISTVANTTDETVIANPTPNRRPANKPQIVAPKEEPITYANNEMNVIDFYELPESIKLQLPVFNISAHVYSSNPQQRSVVINNNFMEEGEYVLDGLILYEITSDGVIFNYQGTMFSYGVISGWQ